MTPDTYTNPTALSSPDVEVSSFPILVALASDAYGPAAAIAAHARRSGAKLIVMGLHRHGRLDRALGNDTVREVMALSGTPVLSVRPELTALPRSVVVAVDFSRASLRAAQLARRLMDEHGTMQLVFVAPPASGIKSESEEGRRLIETNGVEVAFAQVIEELKPEPGMTVLPVRRAGTPVDELRTVCEEVRPDLVVVGSQRHAFLDRLLLGSVSAAMVKDGRWSMLVTPPVASSHG